MSALLAWLVAHEAVVAGAGVAVLDLLFAVAPNIESNGVLHFVYLQLKKLLGNDPAQK